MVPEMCMELTPEQVLEQQEPVYLVYLVFRVYQPVAPSSPLLADHMTVPRILPAQGL